MGHKVLVLASEDSELLEVATLCARFNSSQHYQVHVRILGDHPGEISQGPLTLHESDPDVEPQTLAVTTGHPDATEMTLSAHEAGARILGIGPGKPLVESSALIGVLTSDDPELLCQMAMAQDLGISGKARDPIAKLMVEIRDRPEREWTLARMAQHTGVSFRTLNRRFETAAGTSPGDFVTACRLAVAERLLTENVLRIPEVAITAGFGSADTMRHHFAKRYGCSPGAYRRRTRS